MRFNLNSNLELGEELIVPPGCISTSKTSQPGIHDDSPPNPASSHQAVPAPKSELSKPATLVRGVGEAKRQDVISSQKKYENRRLRVDALSPFMSPAAPKGAAEDRMLVLEHR